MIFITIFGLKGQVYARTCHSGWYLLFLNNNHVFAYASLILVTAPLRLYLYDNQYHARFYSNLLVCIFVSKDIKLFYHYQGTEISVERQFNKMPLWILALTKVQPLHPHDKGAALTSTWQLCHLYLLLIVTLPWITKLIVEQTLSIIICSQEALVWVLDFERLKVTSSMNLVQHFLEAHSFYFYIVALCTT